MVIGILSDTHDRRDAAAAGIDLLRREGAEFLIHCGDVGGRPILDLLAGSGEGGGAAFVWGNTDCDEDELTRYAAHIGIQCLGQHGTLALGGKRVAIAHGHDPAVLKRVLHVERPDYLLTGHTHAAHDCREGATRCINPGALFRAAVKTVALLDLDRDDLRMLTVVT
jgi:putative phosphoesterase